MTKKPHSHGDAFVDKHEPKDKEKFMRRAIELGEYGSLKEKTGGPFGAVVVKDGKIIGEGYNQVIKHNDPTWHAEMQAIREACKKMGTPHLEGCILYTNAECCPMCLAAAYWAHIEHIYHASTTADALEYGNFADIAILDELKKDPLMRKIQSVEFMRSDAVEIWKRFAVMIDKVHY